MPGAIDFVGGGERTLGVDVHERVQRVLRRRDPVERVLYDLPRRHLPAAYPPRRHPNVHPANRTHPSPFGLRCTSVGTGQQECNANRVGGGRGWGRWSATPGDADVEGGGRYDPEHLGVGRRVGCVGTLVAIQRGVQSDEVVGGELRPIAVECSVSLGLDR